MSCRRTTLISAATSAATDDEGAAILQVFLERGVTEDQMRGLVAGEDIRSAIAAVLDALEAGKLTLSP
jgi:hypothetical protein